MGPGKGKQGLMQQMSKQMASRGTLNPHNMQMNIQQMSRMLPPQVCCVQHGFPSAIVKTRVQISTGKAACLVQRVLRLSLSKVRVLLQVLKQMGGAGALQGLLKQMEASGMK
jgi:hypothetical protein